MHVVNSSTANLQGLQQDSNSYDLYLSIAMLCYEDPCIHWKEAMPICQVHYGMPLI